MKNQNATTRLLTTSFFVACALAATAAVPYAEGFEDPGFSAPPIASGPGWFSYNSALTRVPSGTGGVTSIEGAHHGAITPPGAGFSGVFSRLGGYSNSFNGGYVTSLDVYIDLNDPAVLGDTYGWDLSVASSDQTSGHRRDFIFHTASNALGQVLVGGSNNSNFARRNDLGSINHYTITTSGWYRFEHVFRDNGSGVLAVDMNLKDPNTNQVLWTETRSDASDLLATVVGGNRYMWFTFLATNNLAIDHARVRSLSRVVDSFGAASWKSSDTRSASGVNQKGTTLSHDYHPGRTSAADIEIAKQIIFMGEGQVVTAQTAGAAPASPSGSFGGLGYVRLDGTNSNSGKSDFTTFNANGFGLTNDIFASGFSGSYRYYTQSLNTPRTPGFSFYGYNPTTNQFFSVTYVQTGYTPNSWNTATVDETTSLWSARVNNVPLPGGPKTLADWKLDGAAAPLFGPTAFIYEHGFNLGSSQRDCVVYLDWMQMSTMYDGDMIDFRSTPGLLSALPVDLNGTYTAPGATTTSNAIASATTFASADQVVELAGGIAPVNENTFTPFSDGSKAPAGLSGLNMVGKSYVVDLDVMDSSLWTVGQEYFQVGLGSGVGYASGTPESFVAIRKIATGFEISHATDRGAAAPTSYVSASDNTRFRVQVEIDALGTSATLTVTPLNGTGAGLAVSAGTFALDLVNDNVTSTSFFAGFSSSAATPNKARMTVSNFRTNATTNTQYVFSNDPYNKSTEGAYFGLGQAGLDPAMGGYQTFLQLIGSMVYGSGAYTAYPYPQHIPTANWYELNGVIANNAALVSANATLANLVFTGADGASGSVQVNPNNGGMLNTQFNDGDGNEFAANRVNSNVALFDDGAPSVTGVTATQGTFNVLSTPVMTGSMNIGLTASDAFSGLNQQPSVRIDFAPLGSGPEDVDLTVASSTGSNWVTSYNVPSNAPNGAAELEITAVDRAGNVNTQVFPLNVNTATLTLNLQLESFAASGSVTRGIEITLGDTDSGTTANAPISFDRDVVFSASGAATVVLNANDGLPNTSNVSPAYAVSVKDPAHSLRRTVAVSGTGNQYTASALLLGGNLNRDNKVDIGDYVVYATRFGIPVSPNTPFPQTGSFRHADISGNGVVDTGDFSYISAGFGVRFDDALVGNYGRDDRTIRRRITVEQAIVEAGGDKRAALLDLNRDGIITVEEIQQFLSGPRKR